MLLHDQLGRSYKSWGRDMQAQPPRRRPLAESRLQMQHESQLQKNLAPGRIFERAWAQASAESSLSLPCQTWCCFAELFN